MHLHHSQGTNLTQAQMSAWWIGFSEDDDKNHRRRRKYPQPNRLKSEKHFTKDSEEKEES